MGQARAVVKGSLLWILQSSLASSVRVSWKVSAASFTGDIGISAVPVLNSW